MARRRNPILVAGLVAPVAGGIWASLLLTITLLVGGEAFRSPLLALALFGMTAGYASIVALIITWTLGLAWHTLATCQRWTNLGAYAAAAGVLSSAPLVATIAMVPSMGNAPVPLAIWLVSTSLVVAIVGWFIRRPDRDVANPVTAAP